MAESFARLGDSVYFQDDAGIFVNLFVPSEVRRQNLRLVQETRFPQEDRLKLTIHTPTSARLALRIRVPAWTRGGSARLNGKLLDGFAAPGGYFVMDRKWSDGDQVEIQLPMHLHVCAMPDDPSVQAVMFGPLVLAGRLGTAGLTSDKLRAPPTPPRQVPEYTVESIAVPDIVSSTSDVESWVERIPGRALAFRTRGQQVNNTDVAPTRRVWGPGGHVGGFSA
jgi:DUF1680 family protein